MHARLLRAVIRATYANAQRAGVAALVALSVVLFSIYGPARRALAQEPAQESAGTGCLACHKGIEPIRDAESDMMIEIVELGELEGDPDGCVVCHGGDPAADEKEAAHTTPFYPDPGSSWINENTCGQCHANQVEAQWHSLMMTEAGKIQGVTWAFGAMTGYEHRYGNYDAENPASDAQRLGTPAYRQYMRRLTELEPQVFVQRLTALPDAPTDLDQLEDHPELAGFTYLRNQCLRCHHAVKGREERGDYRGMGCSTCHIPYGNEGLYEGGDPTIPRDRPGHSLVHSIQGTRKARVTVHDVDYSGIPVETCTTCHDRGKRIGVSFQGLMETPYHSPYDAQGRGQPALHTKHYLAMQQDVHYQKGMTCQDCHTSIDVHGDGFLVGANLGAVQIECADCHGTPKKFPWELPLGFGDEFDEAAARGPPRGTAAELTDHLQQGTVYAAEDGYLLTARGNPYSNVTRDGDFVTVHTAAGKDVRLAPLKLLERRKLPEGLGEAGRVAMCAVEQHVGKMECYTCHAGWAPQCYGCHVRIDYSEGKTSFDYLAAGHRHAEPGHRADRGEADYDTLIPGEIHEERSFLRWEDPPMGVNGEGRITPVAPGCQVSATIIGADGKAILTNHIFRTPADTEGGGADGQLSLDMSPTQPHTTAKHARTCESCHASEKALGHGIAGARPTRRPDRAVTVDLETVDGRALPESAKTQIGAIGGLSADWSQFVDRQGNQRQTVGHHFSRSRPLNDRERSHVERSGVCLSCHREIPAGSPALNLLHHVAAYTGQLPKTTEQHDGLVHKIVLFAGWGQVLGIFVVPAAALAAVAWYVRRWRRRRRERTSGK